MNESNEHYRASTRVDFLSNSPVPLEITAQLQCGYLVNNRCALTHDSNLDYWQYLVDIIGQAIFPDDKLKITLNPQDSFNLGVNAKMPYGKESGSYSGQFTVVFDADWD
ncbi:hypothetical protein [Fangia hongkongensis]|uniref:hypothetical protein n=1 Tax=Fangia hongkongensis TaxID=270495 RepID=UPI00036E03B1|nr:hypothetical protein [Fangia hongkongensis]MBK2124932.1 hypothetical protein [Fangia hongkongensis]